MTFRSMSASACLLLLASCTGGAESNGGAGADGAAGRTEVVVDGGASGTTGAAGASAGIGGGAGDTGLAGTTGAAGASAAGTSGAAGTSAAGASGGAGTGAKADAGTPAPTSDGGVTTTAGLRIVFPPAGAVASDQIVVRGTSTLGGAIKVNGVAATSSDGFKTFRATVPLAMGDNTLSVTTDGGAKTEVVVRRFASDGALTRGGGDPFSIFRTFGFAIDAEQANAIMCDDIYDGLVRVDLRTGDRSLASASESSNKGMVGKGYNEIDNPRGVTLDKPGHALVVDGGKLIGIDLASGDRTLLSGAGKGGGTSAKLFVAVGWDQAAGRAVALDYEGNALFGIDPASGDRTVLSGAGKGSGPGFDSYGPMDLDLAHGRALTTRAYVNPVIAIDLASGNRSILSGDGAGSGASLAEPYAPAVAPSLGVVIVWDKSGKKLVSVDLSTGARRVLADATTGSGAELTGVDRMAFGRDLLFVRASGGLLAVDPIDGNRVVVSK
jgi:hypothetical protein